MRQLQDNGDTHAVEKMREIKDEINGNTGNREREGKGRRRKSWADWMLFNGLVGWLGPGCAERGRLPSSANP